MSPTTGSTILCLVTELLNDILKVFVRIPEHSNNHNQISSRRNDGDQQRRWGREEAQKDWRCNVVAQILETLSTTTGATTTAYWKQIFCFGHAQKLNNWLQSADVFTLATPHSLFWLSVDNVAVCKVFSPFWFIHRKPQARRNPLGKIYYIYIFCALAFTDPV